MFTGFVDLFFGCWHRNYSFPISAKQSRRRSQAASQTGMYVVCLDCGKEFAYDWENMRVLGPEKTETVVLTPAETYAHRKAAA